MNAVHDRDRIRELSDVSLPSADTPSPLILADESSLGVSYITKPSVGQADGPSRPPADEVVVVVFRQCYASHFGVPNDEAFSTHPLADRGLQPYGAFEVESSSWIRGLELRNRSHPRHDPQVFQQLRHWVWTFHDSVLECAAQSYTAVNVQGRPDNQLPRMLALLRSS